MYTRDSNKRKATSLLAEKSLKQSKINPDEILPVDIQILESGLIRLKFKTYENFQKFFEVNHSLSYSMDLEGSAFIDFQQLRFWLGEFDADIFLRCAAQLLDRVIFTADVFDRMSPLVANLISRLMDCQSIFDLLINNLTVLERYIHKLSVEACASLVLDKMDDGRTIFDNFLLNVPYTGVLKGSNPSLAVDACVEAIFSKISDETCNILALSQGPDGYSGLTGVVSRCGDQIATSFVERLTPETCNRAALFYDTDSHNTCFGDFCFFASEILIEKFSAKLEPDTLYKALMLRSNHSTLRNPQFRLTALEQLVTRWDKHKLLHFVNQQFSGAYDKANLLRQLDLHGIAVRDRGDAKDSWSDVAGRLIKQSIPVRKRKIGQDIRKHIAAVTLSSIKNSNILHEAEQSGWKFSYLLGRSIILKNIKGDHLVIKIQKLAKQETLTSLKNEYKATTFLKQNKERLGLKSNIPTAVDIVSLSGVVDWVTGQALHMPESLKTFIEMVSTDKKNHAAYIYRVDAKQKEYFTYLHDASLSDEGYRQANDAIVHDLFSLLPEGLVFNQLADVYHNLEHVEERSDQGHYIVLAELVRDMHWRTGSGRLTGWKEAVEYPNVRGTGLADLGDSVSINEYIGNTKRTRDFFSDTLFKHKEQSSNYLIANIMAEYQFVLFLIAGRRALSQATAAKELSANKEEIFSIWLKHAEQVFTNCAYAVSITTHQPMPDILLKMHNIVSVKKLALQMQFWMTDKYIKYMAHDQIPLEIYGRTVPVVVDHRQFRENSFNDQIGFSVNGKTPDLGPVNGQEPIKEANKLFYWMVSLIFQSYNNLSHSLSEVNAMTNEKDIYQSEALRKNSFRYLPDKAYHKLQQTLCEERVNSKQLLPPGMKSALIKEAEEHKFTAAALTIQGLWRKRQSEKNPGKKRKVDLTTVVTAGLRPYFE